MSVTEAHFASHYRPTLQEAVDTFCARRLESHEYQPSTRKSYYQALHGFLHASPDLVYADQLDRACVQRFDEDLQRRQWRASGRRVHIAAVKAFIVYLEEQGILATGISQSIALSRQERGKPARPVDVDDAAALLRAVRQAGQPRDIAVIALLLGTGILVTELTQLTLADLRRASVSASGASSEEMQTTASSMMWSSLQLPRRSSPQRQEAPLDSATGEALNAYLATRPQCSSQNLFLNAVGQPLTVQMVDRIVRRNAREASMPWITARGIRSGYVLRQLAAGASLREAQHQVGHRRIGTTRRFTGLSRSSTHGTAVHRRSRGVLIVDERHDTRRQLRTLLEIAGHKVVEAPDAIIASDMLHVSRLALVVVVSLWGAPEDGSDVLSALMSGEQSFVDHRFILLPHTADSAPMSTSDLAAADGIPIIPRPLNLDALLASIARAYTELGA
jgi:integrase/recombinase XerC